jgi:tyrosyl-tRNA synthetase
MAGLVEELAWRGLVQQKTHEGLAAILDADPVPLYVGFDPTASSLHVGSLLPLLALVRAQKAGHRPIAVVGGATGMVGDPSGKSEERKLLTAETLAQNVAGLRAQLGRFLDFGAGGATLVDNNDWLGKFGYLEFLRDVGKLFSVNMMLAKESVRARLEDRDQGISYTEFSYMLIQAYDFLWLYEHEKCRLQLGGSDQWGNITAGIDLIRRKHGVEAYGLTMPLVMTAAGTKFGKTEKGTVWLDSARTSPYQLFQFFLQTEDADVGKFLRYYTFLDEKRVLELDETVKSAPEKREAQRVLAREVTTMVHGADETARAESAGQALFGGALDALDAATIASVFAEAPSTDLQVEPSALSLPLIDALVQTKLANGKGAARRDIEGGGIYVNNRPVADVAATLGTSDVLAGRFVVLRKGKRSYHLIRLSK